MHSKLLNYLKDIKEYEEELSREDTSGYVVKGLIIWGLLRIENR